MFGLNNVFGLPLHVLLDHFAVVLVPLAALAFLATSWRAQWREKYLVAVTLLAVAGGASAFLSAQSGGALRRSLRAKALNLGTHANFGGHPGSGNRAEIFAILFALAVVAMLLISRTPEHLEIPRWADNTLRLLGSGLGIAAIVTMVLAGHSGAALVWKDLGNYVAGR